MIILMEKTINVNTCMKNERHLYFVQSKQKYARNTWLNNVKLQYWRISLGRKATIKGNVGIIHSI